MPSRRRSRRSRRGSSKKSGRSRRGSRRSSRRRSRRRKSQMEELKPSSFELNIQELLATTQDIEVETPQDKQFEMELEKEMKPILTRYGELWTPHLVSRIWFNFQDVNKPEHVTENDNEEQLMALRGSGDNPKNMIAPRCVACIENIEDEDEFFESWDGLVWHKEHEMCPRCEFPTAKRTRTPFAKMSCGIRVKGVVADDAKFTEQDKQEDFMLPEMAESIEGSVGMDEASGGGGESGGDDGDDEDGGGAEDGGGGEEAGGADDEDGGGGEDAGGGGEGAADAEEGGDEGGGAEGGDDAEAEPEQETPWGSGKALGDTVGGDDGGEGGEGGGGAEGGEDADAGGEAAGGAEGGDDVAGGEEEDGDAAAGGSNVSNINTGRRRFAAFGRNRNRNNAPYQGRWDLDPRGLCDLCRETDERLDKLIMKYRQRLINDINLGYSEHKTLTDIRIEIENERLREQAEMRRLKDLELQKAMTDKTVGGGPDEGGSKRSKRGSRRSKRSKRSKRGSKKRGSRRSSRRKSSRKSSKRRSKSRR